MLKIDERILEELARYNNINKYVSEQAAPAIDEPVDPTAALGTETPEALGTEAPTGLGAEPAGGITPEGTPEMVDVNNDPDVEKVGTDGESTTEGDTEELDITELVTSQKDISQKQEEYFEKLFAQITNLESKLSEMDTLLNKVNSLEANLEKYRPKTPQEKLELRSLDSYPYNQKLTDFFVDKEKDLEKSGKNEYVLTTDEVENFTPSEVRGTFMPKEEQKNFGI